MKVKAFVDLLKGISFGCFKRHMVSFLLRRILKAGLKRLGYSLLSLLSF